MSITATAVLEPSLAGPYRYLDYFHEADRSTFAGREEDIAEVSARASADEPFVLYGRSGLGKTSLLLAGVFPLLRERHLNPVHVRVLATPVLDLRNAIAGVLGKSCGVDASDLHHLVASGSESGGLVLVFDQFEEFFINTRGQPNARREFIQLVAALVRRSHGDVRVTFSLREDYLAELDEFRDAFPDMLTNQYRLRPLTAFGARQAIVAPLLAAGIQFDQRLVVRLVDMLAEVDFDPVLLQIACGEVYREAAKRKEAGSLTEGDLDKVGGIQGLFERYLDNAIARVPQGQLLLCRAMLDALTTPEETKRAVTFEALLTNDDFEASREELQAVLDCLKEQKLVRPDLRGERLFYELAHDRLAPSVVKWFKRDVDFSQFRDARDLIANATRRRALFPDKLETLIGAAQIAKLIAPYRQRLRLTDDQRAMMFWSAVYSRVEDVDFWAKLFGTERACQALLLLLAHSSAEARLGAATAAERLASEMPGVSSACLAQSLEDQDPTVRSAAARALARVAGEAEIVALKTALGSRRTRSRALDVLATFAEVGGPIGKFGRISRFRAHRRARRLALGRHRETIATRGRRGALVGMMAAVGWSATIGSLMACLTVWMRGEVEWVREAFQLWSIGAVSAAALAALCGWRLGRLAAYRAAARGVEGGWASAMLRFAFVGGLFSLFLLGNPILSSVSSSGLFVVVSIAVLLIAGVWLRLFRSSIWPPATTTRSERAGWALLIGLPLAVPLGAFGLFAGDGSETYWLVAAALSGVAAIVALVLSETAVVFPIGTFPGPAPRMRLVTRTLLVLSAVAAPVLFIRLAGWDSIPFHPKTFAVGPDIRVPLPLEMGQVDSAYFALESAGDQPAWFKADYPAGRVELKAESGSLSQSSRVIDRIMWVGDGPSRVADRGQLLYVPPGRHLLSAASQIGPGRDAALQLEALQRLGEETPVQLSQETWSPYVLRLTEVVLEDKAQPRVWRAVVRARVADGSQARGGSVRVLLLAGAPGGGGKIVQLLANEATPSEHGVTYSLPSVLDAIDFPLSVSTDGRELKPIPFEPDGSFRMALDYRPPPDGDPSPGHAPAPVPGARRPLDIPILLAIRAPDFIERIVRNEKPGALLPRLKEDPSTWNDPEGLTRIAQLLSQGERHDESIELYRRVAVLTPNSSTLNELAWEMIIGGRALEALIPAREAAKLSERKDANILDTLAHAEYAAGNLKAALAAWNETIKIDPAHYLPPRDAFCADDLKLIEEARRAMAVAR